MAQLNALPEAAFVRAMDPYFEGAAGFLARLGDARPFDDLDDLFATAATVAFEMPEEEQLELLNAHAPIGARPDSVSAASFVEQGYARERADLSRTADASSEAERQRIQAELARLNDAYEARFGFRFVVFVAGRSRADIVPLMEARLRASRSQELRTALAEVVAIARDRWRKAG